MRVARLIGAVAIGARRSCRILAIFIMRLPAASTDRAQPGGTTVVLSFCSMIAGPANGSPTGSRCAPVERRLERVAARRRRRKTHWPVLTSAFARVAAFRARAARRSSASCADADHAHIDDLDRALGEDGRIRASCAAWKRSRRPSIAAASTVPAGNVDPQLVALARHSADRRRGRTDMLAGIEAIGARIAPRSCGFHRGEVGVEPLEIDSAADLELRCGWRRI